MKQKNCHNFAGKNNFTVGVFFWFGHQTGKKVLWIKAPLAEIQDPPQKKEEQHKGQNVATKLESQMDVHPLMLLSSCCMCQYNIFSLVFWPDCFVSIQIPFICCGRFQEVNPVAFNTFGKQVKQTTKPSSDCQCEVVCFGGDEQPVCIRSHTVVPAWFQSILADYLEFYSVWQMFGKKQLEVLLVWNRSEVHRAN